MMFQKARRSYSSLAVKAVENVFVRSYDREIRDKAVADVAKLVDWNRIMKFAVSAPNQQGRAFIKQQLVTQKDKDRAVIYMKACTLDILDILNMLDRNQDANVTEFCRAIMAIKKCGEKLTEQIGMLAHSFGPPDAKPVLKALEQFSKCIASAKKSTAKSVGMTMRNKVRSAGNRVRASWMVTMTALVGLVMLVLKYHVLVMSVWTYSSGDMSQILSLFDKVGAKTSWFKDNQFRRMVISKATTANFTTGKKGQNWVLFSNGTWVEKDQFNIEWVLGENIHNVLLEIAGKSHLPFKTVVQSILVAKDSIDTLLRFVPLSSLRENVYSVATGAALIMGVLCRGFHRINPLSRLVDVAMSFGGCVSNKIVRGLQSALDVTLRMALQCRTNAQTPVNRAVANRVRAMCGLPNSHSSNIRTLALAQGIKLSGKTPAMLCDELARNRTTKTATTANKRTNNQTRG